MCGVHIWIRQLRIHHGFLCYVPDSSAGAHADMSSGHTSSVRVPRSSVGKNRAGLSQEDLVKQMILSSPVFAEQTTTAELRKALRNKLKDQCGEQIKAACQDLVDAEVLEYASEPFSPTRGHIVLTVKKRAWTAIYHNRSAIEMLERIGIDSQHFP